MNILVYMKKEEFLFLFLSTGNKREGGFCDFCSSKTKKDNVEK